MKFCTTLCLVVLSVEMMGLSITDISLVGTNGPATEDVCVYKGVNFVGSPFLKNTQPSKSHVSSWQSKSGVNWLPCHKNQYNVLGPIRSWSIILQLVSLRECMPSWQLVLALLLIGWVKNQHLLGLLLRRESCELNDALWQNDKISFNYQEPPYDLTTNCNL